MNHIPHRKEADMTIEPFIDALALLGKPDLNNVTCDGCGRKAAVWRDVTTAGSEDWVYCRECMRQLLTIVDVRARNIEARGL
jgi:hypothetical protein